MPVVVTTSGSKIELTEAQRRVTMRLAERNMNGFHFAVMSSSFPKALLGASPSTHRLVTILEPHWAGGSYPFLKDQPVSVSYVSEKFRLGAREAEIQRGVTEMVAAVMDVEMVRR